MAEETPKTEQPAEKSESPKGKGGMMKKLLIFGVPAFFVQLVLIYFLTAKFVVPMTTHYQGVGAADQSGKGKSSEHGETESVDAGKESGNEENIYVIKDMIVNPAGTNGQRYLLSTIAFNLSSEEALKSFEKKEIAVRDLLNSILTSKTMDQLIDVKQREALRQEIVSKSKALIGHGKLNSVYFSKYIIQ